MSNLSYFLTPALKNKKITTFSSLMKVRSKVNIANMTIPFPSPAPLHIHIPLPPILSQDIWPVLSKWTKTLIRVKTHGWWWGGPAFLICLPLRLHFFFSFLVNFLPPFNCREQQIRQQMGLSVSACPTRPGRSGNS